MSPWLSNSAMTVDLLQEAGYRYFMDWTCDDQPIWMKTRSGRILSMPYPIECNDTRGVIWYRYTSGEFTDMLIDGLDEMMRQSEGQPLVCPISLHPFVVGRPYRIRQLRRVFEHLEAASRRDLADSSPRHLRVRRAPAPRNRSRRLKQGRTSGHSAQDIVPSGAGRIPTDSGAGSSIRPRPGRGE